MNLAASHAETDRITEFARDLTHAVRSPARALHSLCHWTRLARYSGVPVTKLLRYRGELLKDREFQQHFSRGRLKVPYVFSGLVELYALVRAVRPRFVVETGVASGMSSAHILRALAANQRGTLYSIDLPNVQQGSVLPQGLATGWVVPESLRGRWNLILGDSRKVLPELIAAVGEIDVFLHDSDHSYESMLFEYEIAFSWLKPGGLLLSDDTHLHAAWDHFCARYRLRAHRLNNFGVTRCIPF